MEVGYAAKQEASEVRKDFTFFVGFGLVSVAVTKFDEFYQFGHFFYFG
jgi:hypothetical protein